MFEYHSFAFCCYCSNPKTRKVENWNCWIFECFSLLQLCVFCVGCMFWTQNGENYKIRFDDQNLVVFAFFVCIEPKETIKLENSIEFSKIKTLCFSCFCEILLSFRRSKNCVSGVFCVFWKKEMRKLKIQVIEFSSFEFSILL